MSTKLNAAALALTLAGGVYLSAESAHGSNMGFKLERSLAVIREVPSDPATRFKNIYFLSSPLFNGLADIAQDGVITTCPGCPLTETLGCVGDPGGPTAGDVTINSMDLLCDIWTDRTINGAMVVQRFDRDTCKYINTSGSKSVAGINFSPPFFDLERDSGHFVTVSSAAAVAPTNRAVVVGSHDPSYGLPTDPVSPRGREIRAPASLCTPRLDFINLPYHSMYQTAREILCGLYGPGLDWQYADAPTNTVPTACNKGIFNDTTGFRRTISMQTFDNINDDSTAPTVDNQFAFASIGFSTAGGYRFGGTDYPLTPGDSYLLGIDANHGSTRFLSPHF